MTTLNQLTTAIQTSLAQPRRVPTQEDIACEAAEAQLVIEANMHAIALCHFNEWSERLFVVMRLLRGSCDHARALTYLLAHNPMDMAGSAMVLHRSQIEQFVRGVFFDRDASDDELQHFLQYDEMPKRSNANDKKVKLHLNDLAQIVHEKMGFDADDKLANMIRNAWDPLNGMVHGGRALMVMYRDNANVIGCHVPPAIQFQIIGNALVLTNFALSVAFERSDQTPEEVHELLTPSMDALSRYQKIRDARIKAMT